MSITLDATEYTFQGEGITASFYPKGAGGLIIEGKTETFFVYQDHHLSKTFGQAEVDIQQIDNVGALVSVVLVESAISGGPVTPIRWSTWTVRRACTSDLWSRLILKVPPAPRRARRPLIGPTHVTEGKKGELP